MPHATPAAVRTHIARQAAAPVYLLVGDDDVEMTGLAGALIAAVDESLRAFNTERFYAGEKGATPASIVEACRLLPMLSDRRVVVVLRAERILKPKRRGRGAVGVEAGDEAVDASPELDLLEAYLRDPVPQTTLVLVAADVDRTRKIYKALQKHATIVECWGLKSGRDGKMDLREAARLAAGLVRQAAAESGRAIEPGAVRLLAERAGTDIVRLRGDIDRLLLFTAGSPTITLADTRQIASAETAQDDWAVTNAIARNDAPEALRQLGLALEAGGVSYAILGQIAWFVRERMAASAPGRVPAAIEALFRTDLELKSSGGDPRVLLERLVVELCRG